MAGKTRSSSVVEDSAISFAKRMDQYIQNSNVFKQAIASAVQEAVLPLQAEIASLKSELNILRSQLTEVKAKANDNEQYSRRNNIRIFGLPEEEGEDCYRKVLWAQCNVNNSVILCGVCYCPPNQSADDERASVPNSDSAEIPILHRYSSDSLSFITVDEELVYKLLSSVNIAKACGCDGVSNKIIKLCCEGLHKAFTNLIIIPHFVLVNILMPGSLLTCCRCSKKTIDS
ncbi:hypothetical protein OS493_025605 [Desmophyllum pertusum]|uniref:Uncharacterized protein n=1 Tax=Desmophyllum pertusum TaxID=174260 RepID=A0A9X0A2D3_9CNID|nr:hypothetical protein OS493_025605 [Desmophyllum pertusum]